MANGRGGFDLTTAANDFKIVYDEAARDIYATDNPTVAMLKKSFNNVGTTFNMYLDLSKGGGLSSGSLGTAAVSKMEQAAVDATSQYYRARFDRKALYKSKDNGAFVEGMAWYARKAPQVFSRYIEVQLYLDKATSGSALVGSGILGTIAAGGVSGTNPYTLTLGSTDVVERFEIHDIVNIGTGDTDEFSVTGVDPDAGTITVNRATGSAIPAAADEIYMQGAEDNGILSIEAITSFASGETLYGVDHQYRFDPGANINAGSKALTSELLDQAAFGIKNRVGRPVDVVATSTLQWRRLAATMEDQKQIQFKPKGVSGVEANFGFTAIRYNGPNGTALIIPSEYIASDKCYLINSREAELKHTVDGPSWFDDDGTVFLREANTDSYEARYGAYMELCAVPSYHGRIHTLSTS
jgi:hypothetical protein